MRLIVALLMLLGGPSVWAQTVGPDQTGYIMTNDVTATFEDIASTGTATLQGKSAADPVAQRSTSTSMGFDFVYHGTTYTTAYWNIFGQLTFSSSELHVTGGNSFCFVTFLSTACNDLSVFVFWDNIAPSAFPMDAVYYETKGSPGARRFIVQWNTNSSDLVFQAVLYETTNAIQLNYLDTDAVVMSDALDNGGGATVALTGPVNGAHFCEPTESGTDPATCERHMTFSVNTARITSNSSILITADTSQIPLACGTGGPVALVGWDADDSGHDTTFQIRPIYQNAYDSVTNGNTGILSICGDALISSCSAADQAGDWILDLAAGMSPAVTVTFRNTPQNILNLDFPSVALLHVASDESDTVNGGIGPTEYLALNYRRYDVANFVNTGGAIVGLTAGDDIMQQPFGYVGILASYSLASVPPLGNIPNTTGQCPGDGYPSGVCRYDNVSTTVVGTAFGVTDTNLDGCCWHNTFLTTPSFMDVLATANEPIEGDMAGQLDGQPAMLGGITTQIGCVASDEDSWIWISKKEEACPDEAC